MPLYLSSDTEEDVEAIVDGTFSKTNNYYRNICRLALEGGISPVAVLALPIRLLDPYLHELSEFLKAKAKSLRF